MKTRVSPRNSGERTRPRVQRLAPSPSARATGQNAQGVFGGGAENSTRGACAPRTSTHRVRST
jgi:hypothetical protein